MATPHGGGVLAALFIVAGMTLAGCGSADIPAGPRARGASLPERAWGSSPTVPGDHQEGRMLILITIGDQQFRAALTDSPASSDLAAQLPLTLDMVDHGSVEKTGPLPAPLSLDGQPRGADPEVGDVGYYAPGHDFVLYHGDQSYYAGIVILGRLEGDAAERIARIDGPVTATIETVADRPSPAGSRPADPMNPTFDFTGRSPWPPAPVAGWAWPPPSLRRGRRRRRHGRHQPRSPDPGSNGPDRRRRTNTAVHARVADEASVAAAVTATVDTFGRLDLAFNNAGIQTPRVDAADEPRRRLRSRECRQPAASGRA